MSEEQKNKKSSKWVVSDKFFFEHLPFLIFLTFLGILYITNTYNVEANVREAERIKKMIVKEKNNFVLSKTKVSLNGQRSEIAKRVDTLGLKESKTPPYIIQLKD